MMPFYLARAAEWRAVADALGAAGRPDGHPLRYVWREAAWCHLLAGRGIPPLPHLRRVIHALTGDPPPDTDDPAALFARLRAAVRFPPIPDPRRRLPAVCTTVALPVSELPDAVLADLTDRVHTRGGEAEVRFDWRSRPALLPAWWEGRLQILRWGNRDRGERVLPPTGWTWRESVARGKWAGADPVPAEVPARYALMNGVWYKVTRGVQGLVVRTRAGEPVVYLLCEPSTRYYRVMTRADWMPVLVGEII